MLEFSGCKYLLEVLPKKNPNFAVFKKLYDNFNEAVKEAKEMANTQRESGNESIFLVYKMWAAGGKLWPAKSKVEVLSLN